VDISSEEYDAILNQAREKILAESGFTVSEYLETKNQINSERISTKSKRDSEFKEIFEKVSVIKGEKGETPTDEKIIELIRPLIPTPIPGKTPTQKELVELIKPLIPKVKNGETPSNERLLSLIRPLLSTDIETYINPLEAAVGYIEDKVNNIKIPDIPKPIDIEELRENFRNDFSEFLRKNIDILGMPDFRKLALGLQSQIDELNSGGGGHTIQDEGSDLTQRTKLNFVGSGVTVTDDSGNDATKVTITSGGITRTIVSTSDNTDLAATAGTDYVYIITGAHTLTLPTAVGNTNRYTVKNNDSSARSLFTVGSELIEGQQFFISIASGASVDVISDGTNWYVI
jgi:hypothetical protein